MNTEAEKLAMALLTGQVRDMSALAPPIDYSQLAEDEWLAAGAPDYIEEALIQPDDVVPFEAAKTAGKGLLALALMGGIKPVGKAAAAYAVPEAVKLAQRRVVEPLGALGDDGVEVALSGTRPIRWEAGAKLTKEQKAEVLKRVKDVYKEAKLQKVAKDISRYGDEVMGYPYTPELFKKSDITGAGVRHYVTLPDGRLAHPSELFPQIKQAEIDAALAAQMATERDAAARLNELMQYRLADDLGGANAAFNRANYNPLAAIQPDKPPAWGSTLLTKDGKFIRVKSPTDLELLKGEGFQFHSYIDELGNLKR